MKRILIALMVLSFSLVASAFAGDLTGVITETKCGATHKGGSEKDMSCIQQCVKSSAGKLALLVAGDRLYMITNPAKATGHEGHTVTVTGKVDENAKTVTIDTLALAVAQRVSSGTTTTTSRHVVINQVRLSDEQVQALERMYRTRIQDARYWYDRTSGAWGVQGGPTLGFIQAGLDIGGTLSEDASNGSTGVFINGRQLHLLDVLGLQQLGPVLPGRYWVDAWGNFGYQGGIMIGNLWLLAQQRRGGARSAGPWATYRGGGVVTSDGDVQFGNQIWFPGK